MKDTDEIFEEMAASFEGKSGVKLSRGGDMALRLYAVAAELATLWSQADWLKIQGFPQTATGECLEAHALMRGLERGGAACAGGKIKFFIDEAVGSDLAIAKGTVCLNAAGVEFLTTEAAAITAGATSCEAAAVCREGGSFGNVPAGSICYMSMAPVGVTGCTNELAFSGGTDPEGDESLRARVLESFRSLPNGSNSAYYEQAALSADGVASAVVLPRNRGVGTVDIVVSAPDGVPGETVLSALEDKLGEEREICVDIEVSAPTAVTVNVTAAVDVAEGYDETEVVSAVKSAVEGLFDGKMLGKSVFVAKIGSVIFGVEGVSNYAITVPAADVEIGATELPVAGTITITGR